MGETDDKDIVPAETPTNNDVDEPKETEKLLKDEPKHVEVEPHTNGNGNGKVDDDEPKSVDEAVEKTNGAEVINIPETSQEEEPQVREMKSRKLPLGGIKKIPEFFKRSKSKPSSDGAEGELLDNAGNEAKADDEQAEGAEGETAATADTTNDEEKAAAEPATPAPSKLAFLSNISIPKPHIRIPNPFAKKASVDIKPEEKIEEPEKNEGSSQYKFTYIYLLLANYHNF